MLRTLYSCPHVFTTQVPGLAAVDDKIIKLLVDVSQNMRLQYSHKRNKQEMSYMLIFHAAIAVFSVFTKVLLMYNNDLRFLLLVL